MACSMTGFGQAHGRHGDWQLHVSVRTVNHRFLELRAHHTRELDALDAVIADAAKQVFHRGRVDIQLDCILEQPHDQTRLPLDAEHMRVAVEKLRHILSNAGLPSQITLSDMLLILPPRSTPSLPEATTLWPHLKPLLAVALADAQAARAREGQQLAEQLARLGHALQEHVSQIRTALPDLQQHWKVRIRERISEWLADQSVSLDGDRLLQECAVQLSRADVAEELERLEIHIKALHHGLSSGETQGKRLDFLTQELQREANTLGSKVPDLSHHVLPMKHLVEQMKEQVQNLE